jgi:hypothetical protein
MFVCGHARKALVMTDKKEDVVDNGGRRLGIDRRQMDLPFDGDDRRSGNERRSRGDRRDKWSYSEKDNERRQSFHIKPRRR